MRNSRHLRWRRLWQRPVVSVQRIRPIGKLAVDLGELCGVPEIHATDRERRSSPVRDTTPTKKPPGADEATMFLEMRRRELPSPAWERGRRRTRQDQISRRPGRPKVKLRTYRDPHRAKKNRFFCRTISWGSA